MRSSFPALNLGADSPVSLAQEPHRGEVYKELHEQYLELHRKASQCKFELLQLRKEYAEKIELARVSSQISAEIELDKRRSLELINALSRIISETNESTTRDQKAAIFRKHLHKLSEWNPRISPLLRFVESQVTLRPKKSKPWAP